MEALRQKEGPGPFTRQVEPVSVTDVAAGERRGHLSHVRWNPCPLQTWLRGRGGAICHTSGGTRVRYRRGCGGEAGPSFTRQVEAVSVTDVAAGERRGHLSYVRWKPCQLQTWLQGRGGAIFHTSGGSRVSYRRGCRGEA